MRLTAGTRWSKAIYLEAAEKQRKTKISDLQGHLQGPNVTGPTSITHMGRGEHLPGL